MRSRCKGRIFSGSGTVSVAQQRVAFSRPLERPLFVIRCKGEMEKKKKPSLPPPPNSLPPFYILTCDRSSRYELAGLCYYISCLFLHVWKHLRWQCNLRLCCKNCFYCCSMLASFLGNCSFIFLGVTSDEMLALFVLQQSSRH